MKWDLKYLMSLSLSLSNVLILLALVDVHLSQ